MTNLVFRRFDNHQRIQHILMLSSFLVLALTGLPIKYDQSRLSHWIVSLFNGIDNMLSVHMIAAGVIIAVFIYHLLYLLFYPFATKKASWAIVPSGKDFADVAKDIPYLLGLRKEGPKFARYSYKEKFDYWAVFWGMFIMGVSGVMMWKPAFFAQFMPRWIIDSARYAHTDEAILAISAIFIWHFFNVHLSPKFFPMNHSWYRGTVSREEMEEDHPLDLEKLEKEDSHVR